MCRYTPLLTIAILLISSCTQNSISRADSISELGVSPDGLSFFVAPDGNDENRGTLTEPFATLEQAREAVRKSNKTGAKSVTVYLREGVYYLSQIN